jgi:hypothetical protein
MKEQPIKPADRKDRKYTLSRLGERAVKWLKREEIKNDFEAFCCGCLRPVPKCTCPEYRDN